MRINNKYFNTKEKKIPNIYPNLYLDNTVKHIENPNPKGAPLQINLNFLKGERCLTAHA